MIRWMLLLLATLIPTALAAQEADMLIIAHRGASGDRPEHTLAAYELGVRQGADYIEPDLVPTADGVLVARHENEISGTTDVADRPEFADRHTTKMIDGEEVSGWFTEDFTLAELRTLRVRERLPEIRPQNTAFDGLYQVPTLTEVIQLARALEEETGRTVGLYPEIKHPTYFEGLGCDLAAMLVEQLHSAGYEGAEAPAFIQSFDIAPLRRLNGMTDIRLVQLVSNEGGPADDPSRSYADMVTPEGLAEIAEYADGIGAAIPLLLGEDGASTGVIEAAQAGGLLVHAWTARKENIFLPAALRSSADDAEEGAMEVLIRLLESAGVDAVFTDDPGLMLGTISD
ncbi:glycerophosphodiester phosphodiesterase [Aurantiacibacter gangjinensis]|uniref:glycerophosphodiester phosphodiesterase n=1 Tax=Aurantiacibacter gangjinensis TaxID=502682 RepID=A0A0G9ML32_9SPHN|nr:glycerophosphodiester phosphodiesterase [Aurantiacibacter gangjinensis]APE27184.1 Glycerophosphoryl diester phosphodiesterase [Aurantiacibacter gangjinensis]KLE31319.1 glycerophosphodiester phosphodiesterase [Aurantiacibacter gangjinensis]